MKYEEKLRVLNKSYFNKIHTYSLSFMVYLYGV